MYHEPEHALLSSSDAQIMLRLGIPKFTKSVKSYGKILYSNNLLTYDTSSIYCIDKLHITFRMLQNIDTSISNVYYNREELIVDDLLTLKSNYRNGNNYHYSFIIEYDNIHFGYIHLCNTKSVMICKVEVDNRILYEQSMIYVLSRLFHIAKVFNLKFNNISILDIARDTLTQLYSELSIIYYQSTKCNGTVHELSGTKPQFKPVTRIKIHDYPDEDTRKGTFNIGSKKSEVNIRVYCKTPELSDNNFKKDYIRELHFRHFGTDDNVSRAEVSIMANAFSRSGILREFNHDLTEVLNPLNLTTIFFRALGEKLTFNILSSRKWDNANNDKYEKIRLVPQPLAMEIKHKKVSLRTDKIRFTHDNNIKKYKHKLIEYLDEEISFAELKKYLQTKKKKHEFNNEECIKAYDSIRRGNYHNPLAKIKQMRIDRLLLSMNKPNVFIRLKDTLSNIFAKMTMS